MDDLALAAELVRDAGLLAARMRREGVAVERKTSVSDIVTAADKAGERLIVDRLAAERPDDGVVGEEGTDTAGERTWFVDPIDGTYNFSSGIPVWCSAVALTDADGLVLGAVYEPTTDQLWVGGRDARTTCNGNPLPLLEDRRLSDIAIASYLHPTSLPDDTIREPQHRAWRQAATVRMLGSGSVELAAVAAGRLGVWLQVNSLPWDWWPGAALVAAVGGATVAFDAHNHSWYAAGPPSAVAEVVELVSGQPYSA